MYIFSYLGHKCARLVYIISVLYWTWHSIQSQPMCFWIATPLIYLLLGYFMNTSNFWSHILTPVVQKSKKKKKQPPPKKMMVASSGNASRNSFVPIVFILCDRYIIHLVTDIGVSAWFVYELCIYTEGMYQIVLFLLHVLIYLVTDIGVSAWSVYVLCVLREYTRADRWTVYLGSRRSVVTHH